jgi:DNA-binding transcriptional ArsR family regulator
MGSFGDGSNFNGNGDIALTPKTPRKPSPVPQQEAYTLQNLDQIKVLASPLRVRILEAFGQERTTKQVAELLGEKPTKLYHHVDALEKVGLIALSRTRQNRGTVEKYYVAVARTFRADSRAFAPTKKKGSKKNVALQQMISTVFDTTSTELVSLIDQGEGAGKGIEEEGILSFLEIRGTRAQLEDIRSKLRALIQSVTADAESDDGEQQRYRLTLAYYPLDLAKPRPRRKS